MNTTDTTSNNTTLRGTDDSTASTSKQHVFLARGLVAIAWAVTFAVAAGSLTTDFTVGAALLFVLYPLIDVVASVLDARSQYGSARRLLVANAAGSAVAAVALAVAATASVTAGLAVFGVWAVVSGAAQLVVALRRRVQFGKQWPMRLAGGFSVIFGLAFLASAANGNPRLSMVVVYAATGGIDFIIQAWLLARRRRHAATVATTTGPVLKAA